MLLDIFYDYIDQVYKWNLYDGPDGCHYHSGEEQTLGSCFEEIIKARLLISQGYLQDEND